MDYVAAHWKLENYNSAEWGILGENDCVNFASQAMIARGWVMDSVWSSAKNGNAYDSSAAWRSSTAFMKYIAQTGKATALTDQQRDQVKVGDIAQFDWDNTGDRDHTGIVTKVERVGDTISIYFAGQEIVWTVMVYPNGWLSGTRVMMAMSFDRVLPEWLGRVDRRLHVPFNALLAMTVVSHEREPGELGFVSRYHKLGTQLVEQVKQDPDRLPAELDELAWAHVEVDMLRMHVRRRLSERLDGADAVLVTRDGMIGTSRL